MAGVDLVTVKELLGHKTINMTNRYTHLAQEHKAQAVAKLEDRYKAAAESETQSATVSPEMKEAINAVLTPKLEQNRNIFLVRRGADWESSTISKLKWRRRADSNRCIEVLQTSPLTTWVRRLDSLGNMKFSRLATRRKLLTT